MDEDGLNMTRVFMFLEIKTQYWSTYMQILFKLLQAKPCKSKVISFPFFPFLKSPSGFPTANRKITSGRGSAWRLILIDEFAAIVSAATVIALLLAVGHVRLGTAPSLSLPIPTRWHLLVIRAFTFARRTLQQKRKKKKNCRIPLLQPTFRQLWSSKPWSKNTCHCSVWRSWWGSENVRLVTSVLWLGALDCRDSPP